MAFLGSAVSVLSGGGSRLGKCLCLVPLERSPAHTQAAEKVLVRWPWKVTQPGEERAGLWCWKLAKNLIRRGHGGLRGGALWVGMVVMQFCWADTGTAELRCSRSYLLKVSSLRVSCKLFDLIHPPPPLPRSITSSKPTQLGVL